MRSNPTPDSTRVRLSQAEREKKRKAAKKSGRQSYKLGRALSRMLDAMWGK